MQQVLEKDLFIKCAVWYCKIENADLFNYCLLPEAEMQYSPLHSGIQPLQLKAWLLLFSGPSRGSLWLNWSQGCFTVRTAELVFERPFSHICFLSLNGICFWKIIPPSEKQVFIVHSNPLYMFELQFTIFFVVQFYHWKWYW